MNTGQWYGVAASVVGILWLIGGICMLVSATRHWP